MAHFSYRVTPNLEEQDVRIDFTFRWPAPERKDDLQWWACGYFGPQFDRAGDDIPAPAFMSCIRKVGDQVREYEIDVGDHSASVEAPTLYGVVEEGNGSSAQIEFEGFGELGSYAGFREDNEIMHVILFSGGRVPDLEFEATWRNTSLQWEARGPASTFTYLREQFRSSAYLRADSPMTLGEDRFYQRDAHLRTSLPPAQDSGRMFLFTPKPGDPLEDRSQNGYVRPDGTERSSPYGAKLEFSRAVGPWEFWFESSSGRFADDPVLIGTAMDWSVS